MALITSGTSHSQDRKLVPHPHETEFMSALDARSLLAAFPDLIISPATTVQTSFWPFLTAPFTDRFHFFFSLDIPYLPVNNSHFLSYLQ
ncbi:hypothetical protein P7K49_012924 [Saguinus oedipus]|uniref:Uncharacterized protein n=1 Tax=Saguinus oedipus TaxID=9490 RepID=A0ABQ9VEF5_SAGOE|nr:hypothetical protein P7K49_012924 [Saguinus oedipus]